MFSLFSIIRTIIIVNIGRFVKDKRAVTAIEYALIAVAISAMLFIVLGSGDDGLIHKIKEAFRGIQDALSITQEESGK